MRHFLKEKNQKFQVIFSKKVFCTFWALDIAPTLDVPVLLSLALRCKKTNRYALNIFWATGYSIVALALSIYSNFLTFLPMRNFNSKLAKHAPLRLSENISGTMIACMQACVMCSTVFDGGFGEGRGLEQELVARLDDEVDDLCVGHALDRLASDMRDQIVLLQPRRRRRASRVHVLNDIQTTYTNIHTCTYKQQCWTSCCKGHHTTMCVFTPKWAAVMCAYV